MEPLEKPVEKIAHAQRSAYYGEEYPWMVAVIDLHVHAVEAGNQRGYHQHYGDCSHLLHDVVDIVGDDGGKRPKSGVEDVTVDIHGRYGLVKLYLDVFEKVLVAVVLIYVSETPDEHVVALQRCVEVYQSGLKTLKNEEVVVADAFLKLGARLGHALVDVAQILQVPVCRRIQKPDYEVGFRVDADSFAARMVYEVGDEVSVVIAEGEENLVIGDYAEGHGYVWRLAPRRFHGNAQNGQAPVAVVFHAAPFVRVGDAVEKVGRNVEVVKHEHHILLVGARHINPAVRRPALLLYEAIIITIKLSHLRAIWCRP